jgi:hypothetical protein
MRIHSFCFCDMAVFRMVIGGLGGVVPLSRAGPIDL